MKVTWIGFQMNVSRTCFLWPLLTIFKKIIFREINRVINFQGIQLPQKFDETNFFGTKRHFCHSKVFLENPVQFT